VGYYQQVLAQSAVESIFRAFIAISPDVGYAIKPIIQKAFPEFFVVKSMLDQSMHPSQPQENSFREEFKIILDDMTNKIDVLIMKQDTSKNNPPKVSDKSVVDFKEAINPVFVEIIDI
jgi:hypothetical protein